jgi:hypothetical protein
MVMKSLNKLQGGIKMGTITKAAAVVIGGTGLLYLGGVFNLDDKIRYAYDATKAYIGQSVRSSVCSEAALPTDQTTAPDKLADYVAQQSPHQQRVIASTVYDALPAHAQENFVEDGFKKLPYDSKVAVLETMVDVLQKESRVQDQYSQK